MYSVFGTVLRIRIRRIRIILSDPDTKFYVLNGPYHCLIFKKKMKANNIVVVKTIFIIVLQNKILIKTVLDPPHGFDSGCFKKWLPILSAPYRPFFGGNIFLSSIQTALKIVTFSYPTVSCIMYIETVTLHKVS